MERAENNSQKFTATRVLQSELDRFRVFYDYVMLLDLYVVHNINNGATDDEISNEINNQYNELLKELPFLQKPQNVLIDMNRSTENKKKFIEPNQLKLDSFLYSIVLNMIQKSEITHYQYQNGISNSPYSLN